MFIELAHIAGFPRSPPWSTNLAAKPRTCRVISSHITGSQTASIGRVMGSLPMLAMSGPPPTSSNRGPSITGYTTTDNPVPYKQFAMTNDLGGQWDTTPDLLQIAVAGFTFNRCALLHARLSLAAAPSYALPARRGAFVEGAAQLPFR